ncbi:MAG: TonB family protein [Paracoccus sp. (in: a-proteobacteria)]|nr:TonB family protein [Paracoccus sp. (in: a-proteobacteria)]
MGGLEKLGFVAIAAALHMIAAVMLTRGDAAQGMQAPLPPTEIAAGGEEILSMIESWETPPDVQPELETLQQPEAPVQPEMAEMPEIEMPAAPRLAAPPSEARPNLPEPPRPLPVIDEPEPEPVSDYLLSVSDRPLARPERPRDPAPRRQEPRSEPRRQQATPGPERAQPAAPSRAGQGGEARARSSSGGGGTSAQQTAQVEASWRQQVGNCIARSVSRVSGGRGSHMAVNFVMARSGKVQGVSLTQSSGDSRADGRVVQAVQRASCPAAPASLPGAQYTFTQRFTIR